MQHWRLFFATLVLCVLRPWPVVAASEPFCREYAQIAVRQYNEAAELGVPNIGPPAWSNDYDAHLKWCLSADESAVRAELQKREDALAPYRSGQPQNAPPAAKTGTIVGPLMKVDDACTRYAKDAVAQQQLNVQKQCGFGGPRWSADQAYHESWCRRQPSIDAAMAEHKARLNMLTACQTPAVPQGKSAAGGVLRVPGLVIGLRHVRCKDRSIGAGASAPRGNNQSGSGAMVDPTVYPHPVLSYECGGDLGAPKDVGFAWNSFPDTAGPAPESLRLPSGIVLYLWHNRNQPRPFKYSGLGFAFPPKRFSSVNVTGVPAGLDLFVGGDVVGNDTGISALSSGYRWFETDGSKFDGDWNIIDRLPKYTVIGLKHSANQPAKRLAWLSPDRTHVMTYDPSCDSCPVPPGFRRVHGGDRGAPAGVGYDWFEKETGVEPIDIR